MSRRRLREGRRIGVFVDVSMAAGYTREQAEEIARGAMALDVEEAYAINAELERLARQALAGGRS